MKIIAAPNSFKGCLDGYQAAEAIRRGIHRFSPLIDVECLPVTDGGDGLVDILSRSLDGEILTAAVAGPLRHSITAPYGYIRKSHTGIVEMAKASGLALVPPNRRNPAKTTTLGTGQLIRQCLDLHAERIILGLGGSATCDGGIGAAAALGYRFLDGRGDALEPIGESLIHIQTIDVEQVDARIFDVAIEALCDVGNPLTGSNGASYVYSPQKGADAEQVRILDQGLSNLAEVIRKDLGLDVEMLPGAGAAGGLGAAVHAFFHGELKKGIELVIEILGLREKLKGADLVITGEGRIDFQTQFDKAPAGVAAAAREAGVPCVAICGAIGKNIEDLYDLGIDAVFSLCREPVSLEKAIADGEHLLEEAAEQVVRLFLATRKK
ncbi:glycerate kinase family protein [Desulfopila inferna]|uniref:glycerate kinase family protein n=1 Tax=Desulfopila inferna TaxID=468528 RepID=UPI001964DCFD|nr:glycerate kinase [Desulfopila inferna]MBM9603257.1 glycerate kinase [Desulfopila inferna]